MLSFLTKLELGFRNDNSKAWFSLEYHPLDSLPIRCGKAWMLVGNRGFTELPFGIIITKTMVWKKINVVPGYPSNVNLSNFRQLGLHSERWLKTEWRRLEESLKFYLKIPNYDTFPKKKTFYTGNYTEKRYYKNLSFFEKKLGLRSKHFRYILRMNSNESASIGLESLCELFSYVLYQHIFEIPTSTPSSVYFESYGRRRLAFLDSSGVPLDWILPCFLRFLESFHWDFKLASVRFNAWSEKLIVVVKY